MEGQKQWKWMAGQKWKDEWKGWMDGQNDKSNGKDGWVEMERRIGRDGRINGKKKE